MKKLLAIIAGIFLSTAAINPVLAVPGTDIKCVGEGGCHVVVTIGEQTFDLSRFITSVQGGLFALPSQTVEGTLGTATISATLNPDPQIIFAFAGTNFTAGNLFFGAHFDTPVNLNGTINASASIAYTLTDGGETPNGSVTLTPSPNAKTAVFTDFVFGFPIVNKGVDVGDLATATVAANVNCTALLPGAGGSASCGPYAAANSFLLPGNATQMNADLGLIITANDAFSLTGAVTQNESVVPEPASLLLIGTGLLGLAGWRRYSSRG